jgi:WD40 repeat protein
VADLDNPSGVECDEGHLQAVSAMTFSPDGSKLALASSDQGRGMWVARESSR